MTCVLDALVHGHFNHGLWRMLAPWVLEERVGREPSFLMSSGLLTSTWHLHGVASAGWDSTLVLARIEVSPPDFTQCRNSWSAFFQGGLKQSEGTESCLVHSLSFLKWMLFSCWKNRRCALRGSKARMCGLLCTLASASIDLFLVEQARPWYYSFLTRRMWNWRLSFSAPRRCMSWKQQESIILITGISSLSTQGLYEETGSLSSHLFLCLRKITSTQLGTPPSEPVFGLSCPCLAPGLLLLSWAVSGKSKMSVVSGRSG